MMRVIRSEDVPAPKTMRDKDEGIRLQKRANAMLMKGNTDSDYQAIRRAAEEHLGIWDWQTKVPSWKRVGTTNIDHLRPKACLEIGEDRRVCAYLPAGSDVCRKHECPTA